MTISQSTIKLAAAYIRLLDDARALRQGLIDHPDSKLELQRVHGDSLYDEVRVKPDLPPDLRLAVVDHLIERISKRLGDLGVAV